MFGMTKVNRMEEERENVSFGQLIPPSTVRTLRNRFPWSEKLSRRTRGY